MKKLPRLSVVALFGAILLTPIARAITISVYADAAPNAYGSPDYAPWWAAAQDAAINGTFVNMAHSVDARNAGTTMFNIRDAVTYSFGDLGRRMHFVYWIPGETVKDLLAAHFEIGIDWVWDGVTLPDWNYGVEWVTPASWIERDGGVIGTAGASIWGAYGINTPEALEADIAASQPYMDAFSFRIRADNLDSTTLLTVTQRVPDGVSSLLLLAPGFGLLTILRRRRS